MVAVAPATCAGAYENTGGCGTPVSFAAPGLAALAAAEALAASAPKMRFHHEPFSSPLLGDVAEPAPAAAAAAAAAALVEPEGTVAPPTTGDGPSSKCDCTCTFNSACVANERRHTGHGSVAGALALMGAEAGARSAACLRSSASISAWIRLAISASSSTCSAWLA